MEVKNLAVMSFDGVHLLLPQQDVATIEVATSIDGEVDAAGSIGTMNSGGQKWPVFVLTSDFKTRPDRPETYKFCVGFNHDNQGSFSIACEEVSSLSVEKASDLKPVHTCMRVSDCLVESLLLKDNNMMLVSNTELMHQFLMPEVAEV